jgi:hypothetical protein
MNRISDMDLAYLAGLTDGEGCFTISRAKPRVKQRSTNYRLYFKITMGHEPTIRRLREIIGCGSVTKQKSRKWNDAWTIWLANRQAVGLIALLRPYLFTKAIEADIALEWGLLPLAPRGGRGGGHVVPADLLRARQLLFERLRDAKPSARFRRRTA